MEEALKSLASEHPEIESITVAYYGSGDSFEEFHDIECHPEGDLDVSDIEDLLWEAIEKSDANFNDEGCCGTVTIRLRPTFAVNVEVNHNVMTTEPGDGWSWESEQGPTDFDVGKFENL